MPKAKSKLKLPPLDDDTVANCMLNAKLSKADANARTALMEINANITAASKSKSKGTSNGKVTKDRPPTKAEIDRKLARAARLADRIRIDTKKLKPKCVWDKESYRNNALNNEDHSFHALYMCYEKGPDGSPTYDQGGYQLDYFKVCEWHRPRMPSKGKMFDMVAFEEEKREDVEMAKIFFEPGAAPDWNHISPLMMYAWKAQVEEDLGDVPFHKIGLREFERWEKRGFKKAKKGQLEQFSDEEGDRLFKKAEGAAFRK